MLQAVEIYTSAAAREGRAAIGVVLRDVDGQTLRVIARPASPAPPRVLAYRAALHGVLRAKSLGARRIRVFTEDPDVMAELEGRGEVPPDLIGLYLQTKAMLNAYRWSRVELIGREQNAEAALAAAEALERSAAAPRGAPEDEDLEMLPLWLSAEYAASGSSRR